MDKQLEEMVKEIKEAQPIFYSSIAEYLYDLGYRKIPENAVVLTREKLFIDRNQLSKEKQIEIIHNIILGNLDYGYEETARAIYDANYRKIPKLGVILPFDHYDNLLKFDKEVRKETAEKFAEKLKADVSEDDELHEALNYYLKRDYFEYIDERCRELVNE